MKVITANEDSLREFSLSTIEQVESISEFPNILVLGIANGGLPLAEMIFECYKGRSKFVKLASVRCSRPSTKKKNSGPLSKLFSTIIKLSPVYLLNLMRITEHYILSRTRDKNREYIEIGKIDYSDFDLILIVDDAVDSGYSLKFVADSVEEKAPRAKIYKSVFVTTQDNPIYKADFSYLSGVLVRFPWSADAK
ncbi:hypothetical protein [Ferrimonas balearica]|uniref:hypothetical protein n=1 Tax=Ferrimonas balearica TaxID=44012 RepID=UPI001C984C0A|nr:hypothetical protein [Ferrimonas balearica]MBY6225135.1 hypothetical protein [Ferrimonas balearica]